LIFKLNTINYEIPEKNFESKASDTIEPNLDIIQSPKDKVYRLYIKPHPPNFTKGRYLEFIDFKVGRFKVLTQHLISNKEGVDKWFIIQELN